jgi:hypothetical protein
MRNKDLSETEDFLPKDVIRQLADDILSFYSFIDE